MPLVRFMQAHYSDTDTAIGAYVTTHAATWRSGILDHTWAAIISRICGWRREP
jgi:hypothetical protein